MNKTYRYVVLGIVLMSFLLGFCSKTNYSRKNLSESEKDFLSKVRYIITRGEKKKFFSLATVEDKEEFIAQFWQKRDPVPSTEENEFKEGYFDRIDAANHLFRDEGKRDGWLSDRGRVYILLGPPELRRFRPGQLNSAGNQKQWYNHPHEVWYYGFYPILFVDQMENGSFRLTPFSSQHVSTILRTAQDWKPKVAKGEKIPLDYRIKIERGNEDGRMILRLTVPYQGILFQQDEKTFSATITLYVDVFGSDEKKVQTFSKDYAISLTEEELKNAKNYIIETPFKLNPGKYQLQAILESKTDDLRNKKRIKFKI
ncbi:MAG: GWxTD domain-containing protein [bacterium]|nr:GWxTD domain-containing protein [bacterium]